MDKRKIAIVVIVILAVATAGIFTGIKRNQTVPAPATSETAPGVSGGGSPTRAPAPEHIVVPDKTSANIPQNVAKPSVQAPANPLNSATFRGYAIRAANGAFSPDTIIVKQGDTVHLELTAVDKDYDFTQPDYGLTIPMPRGQAKSFQFDATATGKFTFFCKSCGGPSQGPTGSLVVVAK